MPGIELTSPGDTELLVTDATKTIAVWAIDDAPEMYRNLLPSPDRTNPPCSWLALVPEDYPHDISFLTQSPYFGAHTVDKYVLSTGQVLYVGT